MKHKLLGMFLAFGVFAANAADFYVDANSTAETPDGSQASPYKTIVEAVNAANANLAGPNTIYIHGGNDRVYLFSTADDLITIKAANTTLCAWPDTGKPLLELASDLYAKVGKGLSVMTMDAAEKPKDVVLKNLRFKFYSKSLGEDKSHNDGRVIALWNDGTTIDACEFEAAEKLTAYSGAAMVYSEEPENNKNGIGANIIVKNCVFKNIENMGSAVIRAGTKSQIRNNVFIDCGVLIYPVKKADVSDGYFVSNKVINCSTPFYSQGGGYNEVSNAELAYNIFVSSPNVDFFVKKTWGFSSAPKIHHNTIVGAKNFITVDDFDNANGQWKPSVFNNLVILAEGGSLVRENHSGDPPNGSIATSFKNESTFESNVYLAGNFNSGSATQYEVYSLYPNLINRSNFALDAAPIFLETKDIYSPDYYRLNESRYEWARTDDSYVGAVEPIALGLGIAIDDFSVSFQKLAVGCEMSFSVVYSYNEGDVVVCWDFDGDGIYDVEGRESTYSYAYTRSGSYTPSVKLIDSATGKTAVKKYGVSTLDIAGSFVYVDSAALEGGDGSEGAPFRTIQAAMEAVTEHSTMYIRGGDRTYLFESSADAITLSKRGVTVRPWGNYGMPKIKVVNTFGGDATPSVITVTDSAEEVWLLGLEFIYDDCNFVGVKVGDTSAQGHILDIWGNKCVIEACVFKRESESASGETYAIYAHAAEKSQNYGMDIKVRDCQFEGCLKTIHCGKNPVMEKNVFENCAGIFYSLKGCDCEFSFVSNRLFECKSLSFDGGNYSEMPRGEIAYNIFVTSTGTPFIKRERYGFTTERSLIHHNTIVGSTNFAHITNIGNGNYTPWCPRMHDNLIVLGKDGVLFREDGDVLKDTHSSSFKTNGGATFNNNAYLSSNKISIGTATELEGYDLSKGLTIEKNRVLTEVPRFLSTDLNSPDYYRLKSRKGDWAFATATGGYPNYVGAIEPQLMADGFSIVVR